MDSMLLDGRYLVQAKIASGGTSTVYRGLDVRLDRPVALKVMDSRYAGDEQFLTRFQLEARTVARLKNSGLVAVYDQGLDARHPFLVMELVEGGTLRELLAERGPMPRMPWWPCCARCWAGWQPRIGPAWCTATSSPKTC
ncbi:tyrosine kinase family protein [Mycobacterium kansasii]|uniref:Tyrosine kinase family protein n=1 Tax=Mycobacterium kansasii TaxID=1768 RepID=A0A1V3WMT3_MYCKA|nr:tyrosine kinase family protein [Mycobacterium kansasii]